MLAYQSMPPRLRKVQLSRVLQASKLSDSFRQAYQITTAHNFSSSPSQNITLQRQRMFAWLNGAGRVFKDPLPGATNYLNAYDFNGNLIRVGKARAERKNPTEPGDEASDGIQQPTSMNIAGKSPIPKEDREDLVVFPENTRFVSQPVLSEQLKEAIFAAVMEKSMTVREVSEKYQIDIKRIGAVIRLKSVERRWIEQGRSLATPYSRAVTAMLPQTQLNSKEPHESINDLTVHKATTVQMFYPTSESRHFTRVDAGQVFQNKLLPAESRIPHPQMVRMLADRSLPSNSAERKEVLQAHMRDVDVAKERKATVLYAKKAAATTVVQARRCDYKFEDVQVERWTVGRYVKGIGSRYGVPPQDRKKSQVKIPKRVG